MVKMMYGERDDDTFSFDGELNGKRLYIALQYNFGEDGGEYEPMCLFKTNNKLNSEYIQNRTEEELDDVINFLFQKI